MFRERDIHRLIEEQEQETKKRIWLKIQAKLSEQGIDITQSSKTVSPKRGWSFGKIVAVFSVVLVVAISSVLLPILLTNNVENTYRYCSKDEYYVEETTLTIGQYASQENLSILSFDWYEKADFSSGMHYKLKSTNEIICLFEEVIDYDGAIVTLQITDNKTMLDYLEIYDEICLQKDNCGSVEIIWAMGANSSYAKFEYDNYLYFLRVDDAIAPDYVLSLAKTLIGSN